MDSVKVCMMILFDSAGYYSMQFKHCMKRADPHLVLHDIISSAQGKQAFWPAVLHYVVRTTQLAGSIGWQQASSACAHSASRHA